MTELGRQAGHAPAHFREGQFVEPDNLQAIGIGLEGSLALGHPEPFEGRVAEHHHEVGGCREQAATRSSNARCKV
jgi:hypothetical protein